MTSTVEQLAFWLSLALLAYVYAGYPVLVYLYSLTRRKPIRSQGWEPRVTVLITAFNEEAAILRKIENTLGLDYDPNKLQVLVASDGSTDATDELVKGIKDPRVMLFRQEGRVGKTETQNNAVRQATGDIIFFSDATTAYRKDVFREVLSYFADEAVGCVAGRLVYVDHGSTTVGAGAQRYWGYETFIKTAESRACSLIGASGCLYAVRRTAYEPMYPEACSDFLICTEVFRKGLKSVFAPEAVCYEDTNRRSDDELRMRVRVISQTFTDLWRNRDMLNPFKSGFFAIELISHKLLRYSIPFLLITLFISSGVLSTYSPVYRWLFGLQLAFYVLAFAGWALERSGHRLSVLAMPLYFVLANFASVLGLYKFLKGERYAAWEPIRQQP